MFMRGQLLLQCDVVLPPNYITIKLKYKPEGKVQVIDSYRLLHKWVEKSKKFITKSCKEQ